MPKPSKTKKPSLARTKSKTKSRSKRVVTKSKSKVTKATAQPKQRLTTRAAIPPVWQLTRNSAQVLWDYRQPLAGITLIYGLLNLILVQGLASSSSVSGLKGSLTQLFHGHFSSLGSSLGIFAVLVGSAGNNSSNTAGAYQLFLALIVSLALIWALRQLLAGNSLRVRDAYYRGMYPLIPFILVLLVIVLQLLPILIGSALYSLVITNGIAISFIEKLAWALIFLATAAATLYMLSSSLFALYIVTLPDMTPRQALRSARELVRNRRWTVLRKVICLPIILFVVAAVIMVPIIIVLTPLAKWVFFLLSVFALATVHTYMYSLYRELLHD